MNEDARIVSQRHVYFLTNTYTFQAHYFSLYYRSIPMKSISASIRWLTALAALSLCVAFAADIDGKWTGQIEGRRGTQTQTIMLKASENTLTGSVQGGRGGPVEISNGTIDGDHVSFTVVREFGGNKITQEYKGTLSGGVLKLTESGGRGEPREVTYQRQ